MLWKWIKDKMLNYPKTRIYEKDSYLTYEDVVVYAENFSKLLTEPCYGIYCKSELMAGIALLACFAAEKTAVPVSFKYGEIFCKQIFEFIEPQYIIDDSTGSLKIVEIIDQSHHSCNCCVEFEVFKVVGYFLNCLVHFCFHICTVSITINHNIL